MAMLSIIGQVIRQLREEKGLTPQELSERINVDVEKLDKIEHNKVIPSLGVLIRISRALGAERITLIEAGKGLPAVITRRDRMKDNPMLVDKGVKRYRNEHLKFYSLAGNKADRHMEPMVVTVEPRQGEKVKVEEVGSEHGGEESLYVLEGEVVLYYGEEIYKLEAGDNIYYDSDVPHFLANETDRAAKVLATIYLPHY